MAVNDQDIDSFGWIYVDQADMGTAQGISSFDIYAGKIKLDGTEYVIPMHVVYLRTGYRDSTTNESHQNSKL